MTTEEYESKRLQAQKGIKVWVEVLKRPQKELCDYGQITMLSKIKNDNNKVGHDTLNNLFEKINEKLAEENFEFHTGFREYVKNSDKMVTDVLENSSGIFLKISGVYEMYHRTTEGNCILKNILELGADGKVLIRGQEGKIYYGKAVNFLNNLIVINIHRAGDYDFYYQIAFDIGNYLMISGENVARIFAVATTISLENMPLATLRVLLRVPKDAISQPFVFQPNTIEMNNLIEKNAALVNYLSENSLLRLKKRVNDEI